MERSELLDAAFLSAGITFICFLIARAISVLMM